MDNFAGDEFVKNSRLLEVVAARGCAVPAASWWLSERFHGEKSGQVGSIYRISYWRESS